MLNKFKQNACLIVGVFLAAILFAAWYPLQIIFNALPYDIGGGLLVYLLSGYVLPLMSFILLILIFNRYLNYLWSVSFAFLAIFSFANTPFRAFLIGILEGKSWLELGSIYPLDIIQIPMPVLSVFIFLILFYSSIKLNYLDYKKIIFFTILWSLLIWIDFIDAIFGLMFWLSYSLIRYYKQRDKHKSFFSAFLTELSVALACVVIYACMYCSSLVSFDVSLLNLSLHKKHVNLYYYLVYFALPCTLMTCVYYIQRIDVYEIFIKFWHVYILMFIEILLIIISNFASKFYKLLILQNHIPFFFLHFYYYVPIVYFASRPLIIYHSGIESNKFACALRKLLYILFNKLSAWYLPFFIFLLCIFSGISAYNNFLYQKSIFKDSKNIYKSN